MSAWPKFSGDVTAAVSEFFSSGYLLNKINDTNLVLNPKNSKRLQDYWFSPYFMPKNNLLGDFKASLWQDERYHWSGSLHSQSAFTHTRLLSENVLLATEIIHGYNNYAVEPSGMLKVDLRMAFDSIRWDFVLATIKATNVPFRFINWVSRCISSASFSISVNGHTWRFFKSTQWLCQGDPMSPYLFVLAIEASSGLLYSRYNSCYIWYHPHTEEVGISHLLFADDMMIFLMVVVLLLT